MTYRLRLILLALVLILPGSPYAFSEVTQYGEKVSVVRKPEEQAAMKSLAWAVEGFDGAQLRVDPRLVLTGRDIARQIHNDFDRQSEILKSIQSDQLKSEYGIYEHAINLFTTTFETTADIQSKIALEYKSTPSGKYTHMGIGVCNPGATGKPGVAVIILYGKRARLYPFPMAVEFPSTHTIHGKLVNACEGMDAKVYLTPPNGSVIELDKVVVGDEFKSSVPFRLGPGNYRLEVMGTNSKSSLMASLMTISVGNFSNDDQATFNIEGFDNVPKNEYGAEDLVVDMINYVRKKEGLSTLKINPNLEKMARRHSADMQDKKYIDHNSPQYGPVKNRSIMAGLGNANVSENLALSSDLVDAMENLLASPAHRRAIIDPNVTHVGVGVVFDDSRKTRHYYITQEFARIE